MVSGLSFLVATQTGISQNLGQIHPSKKPFIIVAASCVVKEFFNIFSKVMLRIYCNYAFKKYCDCI